MVTDLLSIIPEKADIEVFKFFLNLLLLLITWTLGRMLITGWEMKRRQRELDLNARKEFHGLLGDFKSNIRVWNDLDRPNNVDEAKDLYQKVVQAEGSLEAFLNEVATQKKLKETEITILGLYRQGYQTIRQALNGSKEDNVPYNYKDDSYHLFNDLASAITVIAISVSKAPSIEISQKNRRDLVKVRSKDWNLAVREMGRGSSWTKIIDVVTKARQACKA